MTTKKQKEARAISSWITEVQEKAEEAKSNGDILINENHAVTAEQSPKFMYESFPWDLHDANEKPSLTVSSFTVNQYCKEVLKKLNDITGISDRKRIQMIVTKALIEYADQIERGQLKKQ
ncbi:hypothetical protein [Photobacterium damselae]|uniref:hypothetical protein n=1 Tax=Photobacterium damselae TaxID=38293 RepID=UPI001F19AF8A|nr:hypothetical protein [Photobacterium damselae]UKA12945.1 hypothetical protein IHC91_21405 [Photobacterium damselae subsp. damselae]